MPGEVMSLVGGSEAANDAVRQMLGWERPHRGSIRIFGVPLHTCDADLFKKIRKTLGVRSSKVLSTARSAFRQHRAAACAERMLSTRIYPRHRYGQARRIGIDRRH